MKLVWFGLLLLYPLSSQAGIKDDFIKEAMEQCKLTKEDAKKLATKGRTGNVYKFRMCLSNPLEAKSGCKISCENRGSKLGR